MMNRTQQAKSLYKAGDIKGALKIASSFKLGLSKEEQATLKRGYEALVHPQFYVQLGKDVKALSDQAVVLFDTKFNN